MPLLSIEWLGSSPCEVLDALCNLETRHSDYILIFLSAQRLLRRLCILRCIVSPTKHRMVVVQHHTEYQDSAQCALHVAVTHNHPGTVFDSHTRALRQDTPTTAMVDFVLKQSIIDPNHRDAAGNTALHLAGSTRTSGHEYLKLVASLLQHGAVRFTVSK